MINEYSAEGFNVLAISDHNTVTWPWTDWGVDPATTGIVAIPNDEVSGLTSHILAPFGLQPLNGSNYATPQDAINAIVEEGAMPIICHPKVMRYSVKTLDSWSGFQGIEIYNPTEGKRLQSPNFQLWDHLLSDSKRLTQQPIQNRIWGFADDDSHDTSMTGKAWITVYASSVDATNVRRSLVAGSFLANVGLSATISSIIVDNTNGNITVNTDLPVTWEANGLQAVGEGNTLSLLALPLGLTYVRAEISAAGGYVFTQPFFIRQGTQQPPEYGLSVETAGSGTTDIAGTHYFVAGSLLSVQASPADGWMLKNWFINGSNVGSANPYIFVLNDNLNLTAVFVRARLGDINADYKADVIDLYTLSKAFGTVPGNPNWSPNCDLNDDEGIDEPDLHIFSQNYGNTWNP